jgi:outer membrane receptor protein involved in Fe transport
MRNVTSVFFAACLALTVLGLAPQLSHAEDLNFPAQILSESLRALGNQTKTNVLFDPALTGKVNAPAVSGADGVEEVLKSLLVGSGLTFRFIDARTVTVIPADRSGKDKVGKAPSAEAGGGKSALVVTQAEAASSDAESSASGKAFEQKQNTVNPEEDSQSIKLEEVVVTAQKREQRLLEVPISVTALSGEDLERQDTKDILTLSHSVPGFVVVDRGPGEQQYTIRGVGNQNGSSSLVGVYLDEMAITTDPLRQIDLPLIDLARVEVLRGPQGTLYGAGAAGGVLRFITRDPGLSMLAGEASMSLLFPRDGSAGAEVTATLDAPIVEDSFGIRIATDYAHSDGWIEQPAASGKNINDQDVADIRVKSLWRASNDLDIRGTVAIHRASMGWSNYADADYDLQLAVDRSATPPRRRDDYEIYNVTANYDLGGARFTSSTGYLHSDKFLPFSSIYPTLGVELAGANPVLSRVFNQEVRLSSDTPDGRLGWTLGAFYQNSKITNPLVYDVLVVGVGTFPDNVVIARTKSRSWAGFGELSFKVTDRFEIGGGLRYFEDKAEDGISQSEKFDALSPRGFARFQLSGAANIYASVGKGFRSGGFNAVGAPAYDPEKTFSSEIGLKASSPSQRVDFDVSVFTLKYSDVLALAPLSLTNPVNITSNAGKARIKGVDASITWRPSERLRMGAAGNYTDHEFTDTGAAVAYLPGDPLDYVTNHNLSLWSEYEAPLGDERNGYIRLDYSRTGIMHFTNRLLGFFWESDPLSFLNLRLGVRNKGIQLEVFGTNLTNEDGGQVPYGSGDTMSSRPRPRTFGLRVAADLGK